MTQAKTRVGIIGASGRTGRYVSSLLEKDPTFELGAAVVSSQSKLFGTVCSPAVEGGRLAVSYSSDIDAAVVACDALIDFSTRKSSIDAVRAAAGNNRAGKLVPIVIAVTGHDEAELSIIKDSSKKSAILLAANTSLGVFALTELCRRAAAILGPEFDIEISEIHHRQKRDAPSGTAVALAHAIDAEASIAQRWGMGNRQRGEIGVASLRGGDVVGDHTVHFLGDSERIELTHRALDRSVFARGAIELTRRLLRKPPGLYGVRDLIDTFPIGG